MGISRSTSTLAREAVRARLKAQRTVGLAIENTPVAPATSWWIGLADRDAFKEQAAHEYTRMRRSTFSWAVKTSGALTVPT